MPYFVYMMASQRNGTIYIGVTNDLAKRAWEHRHGVADGFTKKYGVKRLVWFEPFEDIAEAIAVEKRMKRWLRAWKLEAIEKLNPDWRDLAEDLTP